MKQVTTRPTRPGVHVRPFPPVFRTFPAGTPLQEITDWKNKTRKELEEKRPEPGAVDGTVAADVEKFLEEKQSELAKSGYASLRSELAAWVLLYGPRRRWTLTKDDVIKARAIWKGDKYSDKTIDNRMIALGRLFHGLDGENAKSPIDGVARLIDKRTTHGNPRTIAPETIQTVARNLKATGETLTLAWFLVLTATGRRPSELARAVETDLDPRGVWFVRTGKGGDPTPLPLNEDAAAAFQFFRKVGGFASTAKFDGSEYVKTLYAAGWPQDWDTSSKRARNRLRPYQARHSVALALIEAGADWRDAAAHMGHNDAKTMERFYTGFVASRLRSTADLLGAARPLGVAKLLKTKKPRPPKKARVVDFKRKEVAG